jgi:tRNA-Thr(GGU) m(6)t(6)A37 methyltransferase TsaA
VIISGGCLLRSRNPLMKIEPIGIIHTPLKNKADAPVQSSRSKTVGRIEVFKEYAAGLIDIEGFSHIVVIFRFHKSRGYRLKLRPHWDDKKRGLFATRAPRRPNQLGLSVLKLLSRRGNVLTVEGVDMLDGTPLLDIKPYIPDGIQKRSVRTGWLSGKMK